MRQEGLLTLFLLSLSFSYTEAQPFGKYANQFPILVK